MATSDTIRRLTQLSKLLRRYAHRWPKNPSVRMFGWVDEYNGLRKSEPEAWSLYCQLRGFAQDHDAYDCMA